MERVNWQQAIRPSTHDLIAAINSGADDITRIDGALDDLETGLDGKAGVSGTYPDFVAGEALSIRSGIRSNTFLTRTLDADVADGIAEIQAIKGNTVVWNQLANFTTSKTQNGITFTVNSDGTITANGTATADAYISVNFASTSGHKYLMKSCPAGGDETTYKAYLINGGFTNANEYGSGIVKAPISSGTATFVAAYIKSGYTANNLVFKPQLIDLTLMFGAGNEPTTVAEFEAQYPADYYAYSAPDMLSSHIAGIEGAGSCEFAAQTLRSAGTAHDVMTKEGIERRIGEVDLGTLDYTVRDSDGIIYTDSIITLSKWPTSASRKANLQCAKFQVIPSGEIHGPNHQTPSPDGTMAMNVSGRTYFVDSNYATAAAFKTAMNGVYLFYELATPTTETFAEPLDLTYSVESGGTEAWIVPSNTQSAAVTGEIAYPVNPARALITHDSFADFCDKLGAYISATITETWNGSKYTYSFASGRSALLGSIESDPDALEVTEKDDIVKEIIEDERKEQ